MNETSMIQTLHRIALVGGSGKCAQAGILITSPGIGVLCYLLVQLSPPWGHGMCTDLVDMPTPRLPHRSSAAPGDVLAGNQDTRESACPLLLLLEQQQMQYKGPAMSQ